VPSGLEIENIVKRFGSTEVLRGVSLAAPSGSITALVGQNGAGKTTLFRILMGLLVPDEGAARLNGRNILGLPVQKKSEVGLGYLPQECGSFPELTVRENLLALLELYPLDATQRDARLQELLALTGIAGLAGRRFGRLSAGEQRRLEIAKALVSKPEMLLLDEPFSGLDPCIVDDIADVLRRLVAEGTGILITDHNAHSILKVAEHGFVLANGRIICDGSPGQILEDDEARRVYFGEGFSVP
jgi:lipopolysaccharide export system ATP-binding protein